jgi:hypothetical protein
MAMGKESGDKTFRLMAVAMMAVTGMAAMLHAVHTVYKDMCGSRNGRDHGHPLPATPTHHGTPAEPPPEPESTGAEGKWERRHPRREHGHAAAHAHARRR